MAGDYKKIAIIGANKEGLKLLPILLGDKRSRIVLIADPNRNAMLFKLKELGYRIPPKYEIEVTTDLERIKKIQGLDIVINALQDQHTEKFLEAQEFKDVEKLGPLSTRLIWGVRASAPQDGLGQDKSHEQTNLLMAFREIVDAVRLTIDRKELLSVILKLATESTRAERGSIMLLNEEKTLRVEIAKGMDEEVVRKIRVPIGEGISGKVAATGKPILISGKARSGDFSRPMDRSDVKSAMCVPLIVNGEFIGVINVSSSESTHVFTEDDLGFLTSLAGLAAEVIQRSNEYESLRVDSAKFTFWKEVDSLMSTQLPLEKRLSAVCKRLVEIVTGLTCFIYVYDDDSGRLMLLASSIRDTKGLGLLTLRPGEGIEGSSAEDMTDTFLVDRTEHGRHIKRVYISLPMITRGQLVGTLNGQLISSQGLSVYHESFLKDIRTLLAESIFKYKQSEREKMRSRKMFAVDEAGLEMISIRDTKRLVTIIATTPAAILGAEGSLLRIKQAGSKRFQTAATFGLDEGKIRDYFLPFEKETVMEVLRKGEPVSREFSEEASPYIRSVLSKPLMVNDEVVGVLSLFNKSGDNSLFPCAFSKHDMDILARFSVYAEKALTNIQPQETKEVRSESAAGGPSPLSIFEQKVEQELNRARRFDRGLVLATVRIVGVKDLAQGRPEFEASLIGHIRRKTRSFDVVIRLNEETFGFLFLDTDEKVTRLLHSITEVIANEETFKKAFAAGKADILYGYAVFPRDGDSFTELFAKASNRVKLDVNRPSEPDYKELGSKW